MPLAGLILKNPFTCHVSEILGQAAPKEVMKQGGLLIPCDPL